MHDPIECRVAVSGQHVCPAGSFCAQRRIGVSWGCACLCFEGWVEVPASSVSSGFSLKHSESVSELRMFLRASLCRCLRSFRELLHTTHATEASAPFHPKANIALTLFGSLQPATDCPVMPAKQKRTEFEAPAVTIEFSSKHQPTQALEFAVLVAQIGNETASDCFRVLGRTEVEWPCLKNGLKRLLHWQQTTPRIALRCETAASMQEPAPKVKPKKSAKHLQFTQSSGEVAGQLTRVLRT